MSKKKGFDIDAQKIIAWSKANIVVLILAVVSIAAVVGLPQVAGNWETVVEDSLRTRGSSFKKLDDLTKTTVLPPGSAESTNVLVNQALLDDYTDATDALRGDAQIVVDRAYRLNQKEYKVLFATKLFPSPSQAQKETLPQLFYRQLEADYKVLLEIANAGQPTSDVELALFLEDARVQFMETNLSTRHDANLTKEQRTSLGKHLARLRMAQLRLHAEEISVYLEEDILGIPAFSISSIPSIGELFNWQWRYWIVSDTVGAIKAVNDGQSVTTSPIKRVVSIEVSGLPVPVEGPSQGDGMPTPGPADPSTGGNPTPFGGPSTGRPPKPSPPPGTGRPRGGEDDGSTLSHTGRKSGSLYDLLQVRLMLIVDTEQIPTVLDGFASHNFLTVIDLELRPEDKFLAMGVGFDYGSASVSELTIVLESAWLRSWTTEFMPDSIKSALGIKTEDE